MPALLNIAAVARRTGIAADTLRKWESRYGVLDPQRTAGGQRRYTEQDVARVEWLRDRLADGWRIGEAARMLDHDDPAPPADPAALRNALLDAVRGDDPTRVGALLDQTFALLPLTVVLDAVLAPALRTIGAEWHAGTLGIVQEHAATARIRAKLEQLMADARGDARGTVVLACAPGEMHDLGLLMLAVALRADGWQVEFLGANTPVEEAIAYAGAIGARAACLSASRPPAREALEAGIAAAADDARAHGVQLVVGGAAFDDGVVPAGVLQSPPTLDGAVEALRTLST